MSTLPIPPTGARSFPDPTHRLSVTLHHPRPGRVLVRAHGEVDLSTVDDFRAVLARAHRKYEPAAGATYRRLICDLSGLTFLAAVGVGALVEAGATARRRGAHLQLVAPPGPARRVLELCGVDRELPTALRLTDLLDEKPPEVPAPRSPW